ncbi:MAG: hypothetical protein BJ554DRAFT_3301 [Olpidium bornovanus]|uniref:Phosphoglucomutase n=1 Tax=Olpidium bornovanus TaxID=278681 RepID=A0A8H7ZPQ3_9FUNG|nr:MAG: hypothetical protein BJ554DRAFT_3301 [Olpidium bornovanus]
MKEIFDFPKIKKFFAENKNFRVLFDGMHGVTGPYARRLFLEELNLPQSSVMNCTPSPNFNGKDVDLSVSFVGQSRALLMAYRPLPAPNKQIPGGHPDPNLTYAHELVERVEKEGIDFGAASDGDGDRNMIIGKGCFVNPSDSVAGGCRAADFPSNSLESETAADVNESCSHSRARRRHSVLQENGHQGARSQHANKQSSRPRRREAELGGWSLGDPWYAAPRQVLFGNAGVEVGGYACLQYNDVLYFRAAWLNILAAENEKKSGVGLNDILQDHYSKFGRNFFSRYDYEEVESEKAAKVFETLRGLISGPGKANFVKSKLTDSKGDEYTVHDADDFEYTDPVDGSVSSKQVADDTFLQC